MNKLIEILETATQALSRISDSPRIDAEILLCHVLKKSRAFLYTHPESILQANLQESWTTLISKRLQGIPIAYLIGEKEFWSLTLTVNEHTLIPRNETELLIDIILNTFPKSKPIKVLDLGTGSGAIALALATEFPNWQIDACDQNAETLLVAKENAEKHHLHHVQFYLSSWFEHIPHASYDLIVSNPPYIEENDPHLMQGDVQFEPRKALVSGLDGLDDIRKIIAKAPEYLTNFGLLLFEHGFNQAQKVQELLNQAHFSKITTWRDLQGHERVTGGILEK